MVYTNFYNPELRSNFKKKSDANICRPPEAFLQNTAHTHLLACVLTSAERRRQRSRGLSPGGAAAGCSPPEKVLGWGWGSVWLHGVQGGDTGKNTNVNMYVTYATHI